MFVCCSIFFCSKLYLWDSAMMLQAVEVHSFSLLNIFHSINRTTVFHSTVDGHLGSFPFFFKNYFINTPKSCNAASSGCNSGPQVCTFLCNWSCDGRTFHLAFVVSCDPCIIFKIKKHTIFYPVWVSLSNYHCWMFLLSELWFAFLDCGHHHVTHTSSRKSIQSSLDPLHRDDIQILAPAQLIMALTGRPKKSEFCTRGPTTSLLQHPQAREGTKRTVASFWLLETMLLWAFLHIYSGTYVPEFF